MIGFVGLSHLGIIYSVATASKGLQVVGYDPDASLCAALNAGQLPVMEPGLTELLSANMASLKFTHDAADLAACGLVFLSLDLPTSQDNRVELSALDSLIEQVLASVSPDTILTVTSQVPPGFTRKLANDAKSRYGHKNLQVFYQVETLVFGQAVERAVNPERLIVGCETPGEEFPSLYNNVLESFDAPVLKMGYESAELSKVALNMYLISSVSVTNTLAELCEAIGADWSEVVPVLRSDRRIGAYAYLSPGLGLSGGNLERDMVTLTDLSAETGTDSGIVPAWQDNSRHRRDWPLKILHSQVLSKSPDPVVAVWGLAYKPDTGSTKNSPALNFIEALESCQLRVYDPQAVLEPGAWPNATQTKTPIEACHKADALAILTPWPEFSAVDLESVKQEMTGRVLIDPFGVLSQEPCAAMGFAHYRLGSSARVANGAA